MEEAWLNKGAWLKQGGTNGCGTSWGRGQAAPTPNNRRTNGSGCSGVVGGAKVGGGVANGEGAWPETISQWVWKAWS